MINIRLLLLMLICAFAAMKSGMAQFQYHYEEYNPDYTFALSSTDNTISCEANTAGDVITLGQQKESASLSGLFYVQKSDENGIIEWAYNYQNFLIDHSKNIVAVDGVGYALVGWAFTGSNLPSPQVGTILMIDEDGKVLWARRFGEQKTRFEDVVYLPGVQEIHAIGYTQDEPSSSKTKGLIVKYDLNGTYLDDIAYEVPGSSVKGLGYDISVEYFGGDTYKIVERVETNSSTPSVLQLTSWDAFGFVSAHQYLV
ncbi:MAG: hypothetical protein MRZ79_03065, partial [Bacteroidia bacterium]|nr:hypothetical protein [Bacteroidia bacterium]